MTVTAEAFTVTAAGRVLLPPIDFTAAPGTITVVTGPSGGGKTTLLKALLGALPTDATHEGRLDVAGTDPLTLGRDLRDWRRRTAAYAGQDPGSALNPVMTVRRLLLESDPTADPGALLRNLGLDPRLLGRRIGELSGGQQRRVGLARAAARRTDVLLLDEPTAGLDPDARARVRDWLGELRDTGRTVIAASHDPEMDADTVAHIGDPHEPRRTWSTTVSDRPLLTVAGLDAAHGDRTVVRDLDLTLHRGQITALTGESGCGKTTVARALAGLHPDATGALHLDGTAVPLTGRRTRDQRRRLQYVAQDPRSALNPARTVEQTLVRAVRLHRGLDKTAARTTARDLLHEVGLPETLLASRPARLSGGQRQRVALARALAAEPDVLIADEITSALDPKSAEQVLDTLLALTRDRGLSILLITHDHDLANELCGAVVDLSPVTRRP